MYALICLFLFNSVTMNGIDNKAAYSADSLSIQETHQLTKHLTDLFNKKMPRKGSIQGIEYNYPEDINDYIDFIHILDKNNVIMDLASGGFKDEVDLYFIKNDSIVNMNYLKDNRRGQFTYQAHNDKYVIVSFDVFVKNIDEVKIKSDSPPYCKLFDYSELWAINIESLKAEKIDEDEGLYQNVSFTDDGDVKFEIYQKYWKGAQLP